MNAGLYRAAKNADMPLHQHKYWELVYYCSGAVDCLVEDTKRPGQAGLYWLTPPGINHGENAVTAYACYWIALDYPASGDWPLFLQDDERQHVERVCQQIVFEFDGKSAGRERMLELLGEQVRMLIDRASSEKILAPAEQSILRAERWMEEHCAQPLAIREVARESGVSISGLRKYFHTLRGCSPRDHLRRVRFDKAMKLLRTSSHKLEMVAELCGYDSASHLSRSVKEFSGRTPGQIRAG
jgi:AraC-like DNA-binding protein